MRSSPLPKKYGWGFMRLTLIRNATLLLELRGRRLLVDPMLDDAGARPPVANTPNPRRNPLVPLPVPADEVVRGLDGVVITHLHSDHFDETAARLLPGSVPVFCQPEDADQLRELGLDVRPVVDAVDWDVSHRPHRCPARNRRARGGARAGKRLRARRPPPARRHGLVRRGGGGDRTPPPRVAVVNGSGARFLEGDPIVMTAEEVREVAARVPVVVVVHREAIAHCPETRAEVRAAVPDDGETLEF